MAICTSLRSLKSQTLYRYRGCNSEFFQVPEPIWGESSGFFLYPADCDSVFFYVPQLISHNSFSSKWKQRLAFRFARCLTYSLYIGRELSMSEKFPTMGKILTHPRSFGEMSHREKLSHTPWGRNQNFSTPVYSTGGRLKLYGLRKLFHTLVVIMSRKIEETLHIIVKIFLCPIAWSDGHNSECDVIRWKGFENCGFRRRGRRKKRMLKFHYARDLIAISSRWAQIWSQIFHE